MKNRPLLVQLVLAFFTLFLLLLATVGVIYYQSSSVAIQTTIEQNNQNTISQSSQFVQSYIQKLEQTSTSLTQNQLVISYAKKVNPATAQQVEDLFETILKTDKDLLAVVLVTKSGQVISTDETIRMKTSSDMMNEEWYNQAIHREAMPVLTPARMGAGEGQWVVSVTQELVDSKGKNLGVLRLDIGYETLASYLDKLKLGQKGFAFIVNQEDQFVYHPKRSVYTSDKEMKAMASYIKTKDNYTKDKNAYVSQRKVAGTDWTLIGVSSLEQLQKVQGQILMVFVGTGVVALGLCLLVTWWILKRWIAPLKDLQQTMLQVGTQKLPLRASEKGSPELVDLSHQFNLMLDRIEQLMKDVREQEQLAHRYELQALSAQINPHFLYNTLDTIVWMAEFNDSKSVVEITKALAHYFRLALNQGKDLIRLADEIDHVRQYLFIQQQRYGDSLQYEIDEDPAFDDLLLPKLVLQPLVENALYHGIKEKVGGGKIVLQVEKKQDWLVISITDNGLGFQTQTKNPLKLGGVGLKNVDQRLKLYFTNGYKMVISSQKNKGSRVELRIRIK